MLTRPPFSRHVALFGIYQTLQSDSACYLRVQEMQDHGYSIYLQSLCFSLRPPHRAPSLAPGSINMQFPSANIFTNEL